MISSSPSLLLVNLSAGENSLIYPLGLDYLTDYLRKNGVIVNSLDLSLFPHDNEEIELANVVRHKGFDIIGFSLRNLCDQIKGGNLYVPRLARLIANTRDILATRGDITPIVVGGAGASLAPETILSMLDADHLISGDGERALLDLCLNPTQFQGERIIEKSLGRIRELEFTRGAWSDVNLFLGAGVDGNIQTKRGCNQSCKYCSYPVIEGAAVRTRDPEIVAEEFLQLKTLGFRKVFIVDGVFNNPPGHAKKILRAIEKRGASLPWTAFFSPRYIDKELIELVKSTGGGQHLKITIESGSDTILSALDKGFQVDDIIRATTLCREMNLPFSFTVIFGGPGEDKGTIKESCRLIKQTRPIYVSASIGMYVYPGTPLAHMTHGELWRDERELLGTKIYPVDSMMVRSLVSRELNQSEFPIYLHE